MHRYLDPVDEIWITTARAFGLEVERSDAAFAAYDGRGVLTISSQEHLDADDSLAQLIFHELCHALVAGRDAGLEGASPDWGMGRAEREDLLREHACQRLQAALGRAHGLRAFMAPTTEHRAYFDALPEDALAPGEDPAIALAREAWLRARNGPWSHALTTALAATARIAAAARPFAAAGSLWRTSAPLHSSGFPLGDDATRTCGDCAWQFVAGPGRPVARCRQTRTGPRPSAQRVDPSERACVRWEPKFADDECGRCGACCREGFDLAPVRRGEAIARLHPALVGQDVFGRACLPRPDGRCVALVGTGGASGPSAEAYRCRVYADRPRACSELEVSGAACLSARRRVGLSA